MLDHRNSQFWWVVSFLRASPLGTVNLWCVRGADRRAGLQAGQPLPSTRRLQTNSGFRGDDCGT